MIHVKMSLVSKVGTRYDRNHNLGFTVNRLHQVGKSSWKSRKNEAAKFQVFAEKSNFRNKNSQVLDLSNNTLQVLNYINRK